MIPVNDINSIPDRIRRLGVYEYQGKYYLNKFRALEAAGKNYIRWNFNDEAFSKFDFTKEPADDLYELYAQRAWQIRAKYDKVILYYSGGIDSTSMLRAFVDNNVPIDAVIVYGAWSAENGKFGDINVSEQKRVAIPYLEHIQRTKNIKLNVYFLDVVDAHRQYNEDWIYQNSYNLVPACIAFSHFDQDPFLQEMMMSGNTCTVRGIDKPRLIYENGHWKMSFLDVTLGGVTSYSNYQDRPYYLLDEFFYWSPDFPELIAKQAHLIARELEAKFTPAECAEKFTRSNKFVKKFYGNLVEPIVYGRYVAQEIGEDRPYFSLPAPMSGPLSHKSWWFFNAQDELRDQNALFAEGILKLKTNIDAMHFNQTPQVQNKIDAWIKNCPIDPRIIPQVGQNDPLFGTVGCWSPDYYIKPYQAPVDQKIIFS